MECPCCRFKIDEEAGLDGAWALCRKWVRSYLLNKRFPEKEQFEAMQILGFLPTHGVDKETGRKWNLPYGHMGWKVDYDWNSIAVNIVR